MAPEKGPPLFIFAVQILNLFHGLGVGDLPKAVSVKIVVAFSYAALADVDEMFASAGGFNQTSPI